jgi:hypothetical protein
MPISFVCPSCQAAITAPDKAARQKGSCPKCGRAVTVPGPRRAPSRKDVAEDLLRLADDVPTKRGSAHRAQEPADEPTRRKPGLFSPPWVVPVAAACVLVPVAFLLLLMYGGLSKPVPPNDPPPYRPPVAATPKTKLTKENFLAVREGMGESEVTLILGPPTKRMEWPDLPQGVIRLKWEEGSKRVEVVLRRKDEDSGLKVSGKGQEGLE